MAANALDYGREAQDEDTEMQPEKDENTSASSSVTKGAHATAQPAFQLRS